MMNSVQDILSIAIVKAVGGHGTPYTNITSAVDENLASNVVTAVLYEEIAEKTTYAT